MKGARALIFPSLWYEGAPLTPLEAMSIGIPCLISEHCSGKEYIKDGENGFVFSNLEDLEEKILKLSNCKNFNMKMDMYSKNNYTENLFKFYNNMLEE